jgi:hypothetical protein
MTEEKIRRIDVFFYGLFMDDALLREKGMNPVDRRMASVERAATVGRPFSSMPDHHCLTWNPTE